MNKYTVWDANDYSEEESCKRFASKNFASFDYPTEFFLCVRNLQALSVALVLFFLYNRLS